MKVVLSPDGFFLCIYNPFFESCYTVVDVDKLPVVKEKQDILAYYLLNGAWHYSEEKQQEINKINFIIYLNGLRRQRETECFTIINRGQPWYNNLTEQQTEELNIWYSAWLAVTETKTIPIKPEWLD